MDINEISYVTFTILDVETTGLYPDTGDRICEIGAIKLKGKEEVARYHTLINPQRPIPDKIFSLSQFDREAIKNAPTFDKIAREFQNFTSGTVLVAQNASFDLKFLNNELTLHNYPRWTGKVIDTIALAKQAMPGLFSYKLDDLAKRLNINILERHRSLGDVKATTQVFLHCLSILQKRNIRTLEALLKIGKPKYRY